MGEDDQLKNVVRISELPLTYPCELDLRQYEDFATQSTWFTIEPSPPVTEDDGDFSRVRVMKKKNDAGSSTFVMMFNAYSAEGLLATLKDGKENYKTPFKWVTAEGDIEILIP